MTVAPEDLRPWATSPAVARELRAMVATSSSSRPLAVVVLLPGAFAPETLPAGAWRTIEGHRAAAVGLEVARDLATGRSDSAGAALSSPPPARCVWCLALDARGGALTWALPVSPPEPAPAGDA